MGNTSSVPERLYKAARANDVNELQGLCRDMRLNGALDIATKRQWLNWTDGEGRTALQWACQQNFLQVVQILLDEGADIHKIAPKRRNGGSPLAEAVAGKHEALVELLLRYGADPFAENKFGKTPFDQALELRAVNIIRSFERLALFAGYVNMKVLQLKGFSHAAKDRWVVIAPRFTPPTSGSGGVGLVRIMLLVYRNAAEAEPRTKCWLDGANIYRSGHEAVLRLHPNHEQPRNAFTKYDNGWMLFFKQASTAYSPAAAGPTGGIGSNSMSAGAAATYAAFMAVCYRPLDHLQAQQQQRAAGAGAGGALPHYSSSASEQRIPAPSPWGGPPPQQQPTGVRPTTVGTSNPGSPVYSSNSPMSPFTQQQAQQQYFHAGLHVQPAAAPPTAAQRPAGQQQLGPEYVVAAAPGETDEEFARRLASMMGAASLSSRPSATASTAAPSAASSRVSSTSLPQQQPAQGASNAVATAAAAGAYPAQGPLHAGQQHGRTGSNASSDADTPSAPPAYPVDTAVASDNPFRHNPFSSNNPFLSDAAAGATGGSGAPYSAAAAGVSGGSAAPYLSPAVAAVAAAAGAAAGSTGASIGAGSADGGSATASDQECCVICLSNPREVGFLHGASVHKCVCRECAGMIQPGTPCPMCRQSIERVIGVY